MKPSFALSLSFDGIRLLHRGRGGWLSVGEVALDDPDMTDKLVWLRKTAAGLAQGAVTTKLIIPNSEILYDRILLKAGSDEKREAQLRGALDGRTPYPVEQLAYDYVLEGDEAQVAVVAHETLREAEAFATEHRFNPVCFVAIPPDNGDGTVFQGEPMFGTSSTAKALLDPADPLERDAEAIKIVGAAELPKLPEDTPVVQVQSPETAASPDTPEPPFEETELDPAAAAAELVMTGLPDHPSQDSLASSETDSSDPAPAPDTTAADKQAPDTQEPDAPDAPSDPAPAPRSVFASRRSHAKDPTPSEASSGLRGRRSRLGFGASGKTAPEAPSADTPPQSPPAPERKEPRFGLGRAKAPAVDASDTPAPESPPVAAPIPPEATDQPLSNTPPAPGEPSPAALARLAAIVPNRRVKPRTDLKDPAEEGAAETTAEGSEEGPKISSVAEAPHPEMLGLPNTPLGLNLAPPVKKPLPIGLFLAGALLAILLIGAVFLMLFTDTPDQAVFDPDTTSPVADQTTDTVQTAAALPQPRLELPDLQTDASLPAIPPQELDAAELADAEPTAPEALAPEQPPAAEELPGIDADLGLEEAPRRVPLPEAEARFAETGIWIRSPEDMPQPEITGLEDLYIASLDPSVTALDAVALPGYQPGRDLRPSTPRPPVGPGLRFTLDENGLVAPSPDGTLSPEGVLVRSAGAASPRPAARPQTAEPQADPEPNTTALAQFRPRPRPNNATELLERAELGGFSRAELAAKRPRPRPESEQAIASAAAIAAGASTAAVLTDPDTGADSEISDSALAVASSRSPSQRPSNIAQIVATARATPQPRETRVAARRSNTPQIPTRASVARQATIQNAISLRRVNLIGVFGSPSNRRAIVRLANGRRVKVEVGDRVDGGQVAAIGESSLQYVKRGRNVTLNVPSGG